MKASRLPFVIGQMGVDGAKAGANIKKFKEAQAEVMKVAAFKGNVALVAGATRGAGRGIAVELGAAGATVYVTGRTTRTRRPGRLKARSLESFASFPPVGFPPAQPNSRSD